MTQPPLPLEPQPDPPYLFTELVHTLNVQLPAEKSLFIALKQYIKNGTIYHNINPAVYQIITFTHHNVESRYFYNIVTKQSQWSYPITDDMIQMVARERKRLSGFKYIPRATNNLLSITNTSNTVRSRSRGSIQLSSLQYTNQHIAAAIQIQRCCRHYIWRCRYKVYHAKRIEKQSMDQELQQRLTLGKHHINALRLSKRASGDTMPLMLRTRSMQINQTAAQQLLLITQPKRNSVMTPIKDHRTASHSISDISQLARPHFTPPHKRYNTASYNMSVQQRLTLANNIRFMRAIVTIQRKFRVRRQRARERLAAKLEVMKYIDLHDIDRHVRASIKLGKRRTKELRATLKRKGSLEPLKLAVYADRLARGELVVEFDQNQQPAQAHNTIVPTESVILPERRTSDSTQSRTALRTGLRRRDADVKDIDVVCNDIPIETTMTVQISAVQPTPKQFRQCMFTPENLAVLEQNKRFMQFVIKIQRKWRQKRKTLQLSRHQTLKRLTAAKHIELAADLQRRLTIGKRRTNDAGNVLITPKNGTQITDTVMSSPASIAHRLSLRSNINRRSGHGLSRFAPTVFDQQAALLNDIQANLNAPLRRGSLHDDYNINHATIQHIVNNKPEYVHAFRTIQIRFRYKRNRARRRLLRRLTSLKLEQDVDANYVCDQRQNH